MTNVYVWYRLAVPQAAALATVRRLQQRVARHTGVRGRLMARDGDVVTWMEVYEGIGDAATFQRALSALVRETGAVALAESGQRHTEQFVDVGDA